MSSDFARTWNRLLHSGALVRGLVLDRSIMGTPSRVPPESLLAQRRHPHRVPVALLRRFFFFEDPEKDHGLLNPDYDLITTDNVAALKGAADLSPTGGARALQDANPFVREECFMALGCRSPDDVAHVVDVMLSSFERTVHVMMRNDGALFGALVAPLLERTVLSADMEARMDYWRGVPMPSALVGQSPATLETFARAHLVLWAIVVWRITAALLVERALNLKPLDDGHATPQSRLHAFLDYNFSLYRDTHLDVLTRMYAKQEWSDEAFVLAALREQMYPHAVRVMCIEELPKMSDVLLDSNIWYDSGIRKTRNSVRQAVAHVFACKCLHQKCQMRDLPKLSMDYADEFLAFNRLFKLNVHCAMLGNMPRCEARPWMAARLRINAAFMYEPGGASTPLRASCIGKWVLERTYPLMFMLREALIYAIEQEVVLDAIMSNSSRWVQHKRITRACNGDVRRILSVQAAKRPTEPFDWTQMERVITNKNGKPKRAGLVIKYHDAGLKSISKMRKDTWERIILKEMISCNTEHGAEIVFDAAESARALEAISEALHLTAWAAAKASKPVMDTRWLQVLGMSEPGFERVRRWIFDYYIYDVSDHGFIDEILALYKARPLDYLILRAYLLLHEHYCNERFFFLPIANVQSQLTALRARFRVPPEYDTPDLLGKCYMCDRCDSWANPLVDPPFVPQVGRMTKAMVGGPLHHVHGGEEGEDEDEEEEDEEDEEDADEGAALRASAAAAAASMRAVGEADRKQAMEQRKKKKVSQSTYSSKAWYDPVQFTLSCRRNHVDDDANPMEDIYADIETMAEEDAEERVGCGAGTGGACLPRSSSTPAKGFEGAATSAANEDDDEDEDDDLFDLFDSMSTGNALSFLEHAPADSLKRLELFAEEEAIAAPAPVPTTTADAPSIASSADLLLRPLSQSAAVPPPPVATTKRVQRKTDPVDGYLARYFRLNNGGRLKRVDMVGVYLRTKRGVYGLCDECGAMTQIDNNRMTNRGISCLHHITTNMELDNPIRILLEQRQWKRMKLRGAIPAALDAMRQRQVTPWRTLSDHTVPPTIAAAILRGERVPGIAALKRLLPVHNTRGDIVKCACCRHAEAEHTLIVYDSLVRLHAIPLCDVDYAHAKATVGTGVIPAFHRLMTLRSGAASAMARERQQKLQDSTRLALTPMDSATL